MREQATVPHWSWSSHPGHSWESPIPCLHQSEVSFGARLCWPISVLKCWLLAYQSLFQCKIGSSNAMGRAQNITMNACVPCDCEFQISKLFYELKQTNKRGQQSFGGFPGPEITWILSLTVAFCSLRYTGL